MGARVACVSVEDDWLSVGRGGLLAARLIFGISVSGQVRYISQVCIKVLMTASWGVGVATQLIAFLAELTDSSHCCLSSLGKACSKT
jgi:hypothetical protein